VLFWLAAVVTGCRQTAAAEQAGSVGLADSTSSTVCHFRAGRACQQQQQQRQQAAERRALNSDLVSGRPLQDTIIRTIRCGWWLRYPKPQTRV